jgi:D-alanyl-lipoteichoic acid acyltransferase DltB (MBOAT superfamily)
MLFNSWTFLPFVLVVLGLYYVLPWRWQNRMLLVASCVFYGSWDWRFLILLVISTSIDFLVGLGLYRAHGPRARKWLLAVSCGVNLGILGFFKYFNFFADNLEDLLAALGLPVAAAHLNIILPIGISFYTFHAMSYAIDIYRGKMKPIASYPDYMLFVLYFPQLVAGPIARAAALIPQITHARTIRGEQVRQGLWLVLWGFFKKLVIADNLAPLVDAAFAAPTTPGGAECLLAVYAFAYQIYCDFSGYTDIARGLGKLMGIELAVNFDRPYLARNPPDFWRRWHISLSTWLRDYLYIPLGGNRHGRWQTYRNLMLTMVLGGLWHGASWTFVVWGAYHGALLVAWHAWAARRPAALGQEDSGGLLRPALSCFVMFQLTCLGWLLFRADSLGQVGQFLAHMATSPALDAGALHIAFALLPLAAVLWVIESWVGNADDPTTAWGWDWLLGQAAVCGLLVAILLFTPSGARAFLYFQF